MVLSGWGDDWSQDRPTNKLWAVLQTCLPMSKCPKLKQRRLTEKYFVCAGDPIDDDNSACEGDSGGSFLKNTVIEQLDIKHHIQLV